jgi:hypothetical protein
MSRLAQLVRDHPLLAVASALGSLGTFAAGTAALAGLLGAGQPSTIGEAIRADELGLRPEIPYSYEQVSDDSGRITVEVPIGWTVTGDGWHAEGLPPIRHDENLGPGLNATPNLDAWMTDLETPGVFIGASQKLLKTHTPRKVLDQFWFNRKCTPWARSAYRDGPFEGEIETQSCKTARWSLLAAVRSEAPRYLVYVQVKLVTTADVEALDQILDTFQLDVDG